MAGPSRLGPLPLITAIPGLINPRTAAQRKRPPRLRLGSTNHPSDEVAGSQSVPSSPIVGNVRRGSRGDADDKVTSVSASTSPGLEAIEERERSDLRQTLAGKPKRRPSMPFSHHIRASREVPSKDIPPDSATSSTGQSARRPEVWRDPSEHALSGRGSTLQHARSVYASGPIQVLPGLYLGDEHNAKDNELLTEYGITTILNVAKETVLPFQYDEGVRPARQRRIGRSAAGLSSRLSPGDGTIERGMTMPSSSTEEERFYTPPTTSRSPGDSLLTPASGYFDGIQSSEPQSPLATGPSHPSSASNHLIRNTLSTPNLQAEFKFSPDRRDPSDRPTHSLAEEIGNDGSHSSAESNNGSSNGASGSSVSRYASSSPTTTPSTEATSFTGENASYKSNLDTTDSNKTAGPSGRPTLSVDTLTPSLGIELPEDAISLTIPASPLSGRTETLRYIKLPWTHDEVGLAAPNGGFTLGCAIVGEALGIDRYGRSVMQEHPSAAGEETPEQTHLTASPSSSAATTIPGSSPPRRGNILVHCQCGVSRSATLVIAFVMQAAAFNYPFWEEARSLTGMHDCYNLVKDLSSSISPNIGLIYQLVEWERYLSTEATRLREALGAHSGDSAVGSIGDDGEVTATVDKSGAAGSSLAHPHGKKASSRKASTPGASGAGWSHDALDEEEWTRMRLEEERKELVEEEERKKRVDEEAKRQAEERRKKREEEEAQEEGDFVDSSRRSSDAMAPSSSSLGARRRKRAPSLVLGGSSPHRPSSDMTAEDQLERAGPPLTVRLGSFTLRGSASTNVSQPLEEVDDDGQEAVASLTRRVPTLSLFEASQDESSGPTIFSASSQKEVSSVPALSSAHPDPFSMAGTAMATTSSSSGISGSRSNSDESAFATIRRGSATSPPTFVVPKKDFGAGVVEMRQQQSASQRTSRSSVSSGDSRPGVRDAFTMMRQVSGDGPGTSGPSVALGIPQDSRLASLQGQDLNDLGAERADLSAERSTKDVRGPSTTSVDVDSEAEERRRRRIAERKERHRRTFSREVVGPVSYWEEGGGR